MPENNLDEELNDGFFVKYLRGIKERWHSFGELSAKEKRQAVTDFLFSKAMYILIITAVIIIAIMRPRFVSVASI